jgi:hypothetical protein
METRTRTKLLLALLAASPAALAALSAPLGCAKSAEDCALLGLPSGCDGGLGTLTATGGAGGTDGGTGGSTGGTGGNTGGTGGAATVCKRARYGDASAQSVAGVAHDGTRALLGGPLQGSLSLGGDTVTGSGSDTFAAVVDSATFKSTWIRRLPIAYRAGAFTTSGSGGDVFVAGTYVILPDGDGGSYAPDLGCGSLSTVGSLVLAQLDAATGACVKTSTYQADLRGARMIVASGGDVILAGVVAPIGVVAANLANQPLLGKGGNDMLVARFGSDGAVKWGHVFGSPGDDEVTGLVADADHIYVAGSFQGSIDFNTGDNPLDSGAAQQGFLLVLDGAGHSTRALGFTGGASAATGLAMIGSDPVVSGKFQASVTVGGTALTATGAASFVARFAAGASAAPAWATVLDKPFSALAPTTDGVVLAGFDGSAQIIAQRVSQKGVALAPVGVAATAPVNVAGVGQRGTALDLFGDFAGTIDTGATAGPLTSAGADDVFMLSLCP